MRCVWGPCTSSLGKCNSRPLCPSWPTYSTGEKKIYPTITHVHDIFKYCHWRTNARSENKHIIGKQTLHVSSGHFSVSWDLRLFLISILIYPTWSRLFFLFFSFFSFPILSFFSTPFFSLLRDYYALVVAEQKCFQKGKHTTRSVVAGVVTRIDLLNFIAKVQEWAIPMTAILNISAVALG